MQCNKESHGDICALFMAPLAFPELQIIWQQLGKQQTTTPDHRGQFQPFQAFLFAEVYAYLLPLETH